MKEEFTSKSSKKNKSWSDAEDMILISMASTATSKQISKFLTGRTAKAVRHRAESLDIKLTGHIKYETDAVLLAGELRVAGFSRKVIEVESGVSRSAQLYYEGKRND